MNDKVFTQEDMSIALSVYQKEVSRLINLTIDKDLLINKLAKEIESLKTKEEINEG